MLAPGTRLGPYEILAPLGAGGMGEVYRAKDTRLGRDVAVKVLPQHLSANEEIRIRFEREARTISSLNHPNICTLFDVGRENETDYLVMELVDGETLADRLRRGPVPGPELLRLGVQISDALDRAHRAGVIHRDLKPGNVMLTRAGAKLMDFGLARAAGMAGQSASGSAMAAMTQSPTVGQALTAEGSLVGTFQYMAPEQLEGREADVRSDVWALGCVLYEMATGKRAFEGRSQATLIAAIIGLQPAPMTEAASGAPPGTLPPQGLDRLIRTCLAKDPEERNQTAHDVKLQLQWIAENAGLSGVATPLPTTAALPVQGTRGSLRLAWGVAALLALVAAAAVAWLWPQAHAPRATYWFKTEVPPGAMTAAWPRVSPDGRLLVFSVADTAGKVSTWVRPLDQAEAHAIPGGESLRRPYWSPDSRELVFVAEGKLQRLPVAGGTRVVVCAAVGGADVSWGSKGMILMDGNFTDSLKSVPAGGGELKPASRIDRALHEVGAAWPSFLPDGEHFLFIGNLENGANGGHIRLGKLGSLDSRLLGTSDGRAEYAPGGWVLYLQGTTLLARKLDLAAGKLTGEPITVAENLNIGASAGHFSVSRTGVFAYAAGDAGGGSTLQEADRAGHPKGVALNASDCVNPVLSPDGHRLMYETTELGGGARREIWVHDLDRGTDAKLTFVNRSARNPVWSPDGHRFACVIRAGERSQILIGSSDGLGAVDTITVPALRDGAVTQWTPVGSRLLFTAADFEGAYVLPADSATRTPNAISGLSEHVGQPLMSPDGRWLAYVTTDGSTLPQVYVQSLTGVPGRWQISTRGGYNPCWTRGGKELIFESNTSLWTVAVESEGVFRPGEPSPLFALPIPAAGAFARTWTCSEDGNRFFLLVPARASNRNGLTVVTDFSRLVNRK